MKMKKLLSLLAIIAFAGCASNYAVKEEKLTVAKAQREIRLGMSGAEVLDVLGSPNMVSTDSQRRETWVYDKMSTTVQGDSSAAGVWILFAAAKSSSYSASSSQRTLTIIVKFDEKGAVRDFAYRSSAF